MTVTAELIEHLRTHRVTRFGFAPCGSCGAPCDRPGQRRCKQCHAAAERERRRSMRSVPWNVSCEARAPSLGLLSEAS